MFVCAPQFFKTPKGLCGHTVYVKQLHGICTTLSTPYMCYRGFRSSGMWHCVVERVVPNVSKELIAWPLKMKAIVPLKRIDNHSPTDKASHPRILKSFSYNNFSFRMTDFWFPSKWEGDLISEYMTVVCLWKIATGKYHHEMSTQKQILSKIKFTSKPKPVPYIFAPSMSTPLELQVYEYDIYL
jgi:hypothetical protein